MHRANTTLVGVWQTLSNIESQRQSTIAEAEAARNKQVNQAATERSSSIESAKLAYEQDKNNAQSTKTASIEEAKSMKSTSLSAIQSGAISNFQIGPEPILSELLKFDFSHLGDGPAEYYQIDDPIGKWGVSGDDRYRLIVSESFNQLDSPSGNFIDNAYAYLADGMRERFGDSFFVNMSDWGAVGTAFGMSTAIVLGAYVSTVAAPAISGVLASSLGSSAIAGVVSTGAGLAAGGAIGGAVEYGGTYAILGAIDAADGEMSINGPTWSGLFTDMAIGAAGEVGGHALGMALGGAVRTTRSVASSAIENSKKIVDNVAVRAASRSLPILNPHFTAKASLGELLIEQAGRRGFTTDQGEAIFWSGLGRGRDGIARSHRYALENGGRTLEMTPGGKYLDDLDLFGRNSPITQAEANQVWEFASRRFAQGASGQVRVVTGTIRPSSVFNTVEYPELISNPSVWGIDILNLLPRIGIR